MYDFYVWFKLVLIPLQFIRPKRHYSLGSNSIYGYISIAIASLIEGHWSIIIILLFIKGFNTWLDPDDTLHKSTSKRHKTDEKLPILQCTFLHQYLEFLKIIIPLNPAPFKECIGIIKNPNIGGETCTTVLSVYSFGSNPKNYLSLCIDLIFSFILVYTRVGRVWN